MNEIIECSCNRQACYSCRRQQIDTAALEIVAREYRVLEGFMTPEKLEAHAWAMAQNYRCAAINALAFEMA